MCKGESCEASGGIWLVIVGAVVNELKGNLLAGGDSHRSVKGFRVTAQSWIHERDVEIRWR